MEELPLILPPLETTERADAASNRQKILAAAQRLFEERGADCVSMQDVARAAGVGMGTMYRRFGDRSGLTYALLSDRHRRFQDELLRGPAPLGPGAPPRERLHAFGRGYLAILDEMAATIASVKGNPVLDGPEQAYRLHLAMLVREAAPEADADYAAVALLAPFEPRIHLHLRRELGWPLERIQDGWCRLADGWAASGAR
jgi:AcrR family transcriptional regulator